MAISGQQTINVGLPNESANSDSLYVAFNKVNDNFDVLFANGSNFNTFAAGAGISVNANANTGTVTVTNTGVRSIVAGTNITISSANGNVTISANAGGNGGGGTVTSVGLAPVSNSRLTVSNSPIVSSGNISIDLANSGVTAGTYTNPNISIDLYGRITSASNGSISGTVTSVGLSPGSGIQITGGPVTTSGNITVTNTGVTRINAGSGIAVSSSNGNVTISTSGTVGGTVTSVGLLSNTLTVSGSPVTLAGNISVELPANIAVSGRLDLSGSENLGNGNAASLLVTASYFTTTGASTATLAAGTNGQIKTFMMVADAGDMVITVTNAGWKSSGTGTITFNDIGDGCTLQYINSKWFCIGQNGVAFA